MPEAPNINGLPGWLQITITLLFGMVTLLVGLRGYLHRPSDETKNVPISLAHLADTGAIRHLADQCHVLAAAIISLERTISDHSHHVRNGTETSEEMCKRLRELREHLEKRQ